MSLCANIIQTSRFREPATQSDSEADCPCLLYFGIRWQHLIPSWPDHCHHSTSRVCTKRFKLVSDTEDRLHGGAGDGATLVVFREASDVDVSW